MAGNEKNAREEVKVVEVSATLPLEEADQTQRFAEIGRLATDISRRETRREKFKECLGAFTGWLKQMESNEVDPPVPAVLRSLVDVSEFAALAREVRSDGMVIDSLKEKFTSMTRRG